jgi:hypothetical protein
MWLRRRFLLIPWSGLLILLLAVSCRDSGAGAAGSGRASNGRADPQGAPAGGATIDEVIYELSGGFAGFRLELRIRNGGEASVHDAGELTRRGRLTGEEWAELVDLIEAAALSALDSEYGRTDGSVADAMSQRVSVRSGEGTVSVGTAGGSIDEPPAGLVALSKRLMELTLTLPASTEPGGTPGGES